MLSTLRRGLIDRRGNVALITAVVLPILILLIGGGIDFRRAADMKAYIQDSGDAAALAGAKAYFASTSLTTAQREAAAKTAAQTYLNAQVAAYKAPISSVNAVPVVNTTTGEIDITISAASPNTFAAILGFPTYPFHTRSTAIAGGKDIEVALILDNTSSMFDSNRFTVMREAAKQYVNDVYDLSGGHVKVSVVPWTTVVNINSETVAGVDSSAAAVGTVPNAGSGRTPLNPAINRISVLANPRNPATAITQAQLDALATPVAWRGCIRSATGEVKADATGKVTQPITDAAPASKWPAALLEPTLTTSLKTWCTAWTSVTVNVTCPTGGGGGGGTPAPTPVPQGALDPRYTDRIWRADNRYDAPGGLAPQAFLQRAATCTSTTTTCNSGKAYTSTNVFNCLGSGSTSWHANGTKNAYFDKTEACSSTTYYVATGLVNATPGNVACVSDPNEIKYLSAGGKVCRWEQDAFTGFNTTTWTATPNWVKSLTPISGPNLNCPVPILPLSPNRKQVLDKLNEMYPVPGGTTADVGILWGLRTLSPQAYWNTFWGLGTGQVPSPWKDTKTSKIAIILTDGMIVAPTQYEGYYGCTDTGRGGKAGSCWKSANLGILNDTAMNNLTLSGCTQLRTTYGVDTYFILVDVTDPNAQALASACAPDAGHAINTTTSQLGDVFKGLVSRSLRLTR